jgi:hypothetical protein
MHHARIAAFLLGAWLMGSLFLAFVATSNFATVDQVLKTPPVEAEKMIQSLGGENARHLLRYLAGEENRGFFETWEVAQLLLGVGLAAILLIGLRQRLTVGLAGAMLILTAFQHFKITPEMIWLGRSIDFISWTADSQARDQFWKLHGAYGIIEGVKLLLMLVIAGFLFTMSRRRSRQRVEVNAVDYADHRHIDR